MSSTVFLLRHLATRIFFPVSLFSIALIVSCVLLFHHRAGKRCYRAGRILLISLVGFWFFISYTGTFWLGLWTGQYLPIAPETLPDGQNYVIAVFGSEYLPDRRFPLEKRFSSHLLLRLGEAARIARCLEKRNVCCRIVFSSFAEKGQEEEIRRSVQAYLQKAGLEKICLSFVLDARNSRQEIKRFKGYAGRKILVSNGFHIPRLMMLAKKYGISAVPAPADSPNLMKGCLTGVYPTSGNIDDFECLCYELLGSAEVKFF